MTKPVFILSLPRSGSTLLQRLLLMSGHCATLGEPSLLLRFLGEDDVVVRKATYWEFLVSIGMKDIRENWSGFDDAYYSGVKDLMLKIYTGLAGGKEWFVDKTPRYTLICEEIHKVFPDAKIIVLWRHPLAVAASMYKTANKGFWYPEEFSIDLYEGMMRLHAFSRSHEDEICEVRYEDLVVNPAAELKRIGEYLGWDGLEEVLRTPLISSAGGSLGDPTGVKKFKTVSSSNLNKWEELYNNWYRRCWARRYFRGERLAAMRQYGYELPEGISGMRFWRWNLLAGMKDWILAASRNSRRIRNPVLITRFLRKFRKKYGYGVMFR
ncbi:sulfotransferase family protein [Geothermobacter ehrlichii]|uniref:Sulfotransferase family protein n=1 Tax=Geothermobacter ehrlichii TaxID=213224 RepID=A0A5D3WQH2_9BACT|nr:sulfotransferase [Geothermobacter ehrlichii]TYP00050.1 sulfotransferase family protein [Geothermobacter ehrlichii]